MEDHSITEYHGRINVLERIHRLVLDGEIYVFYVLVSAKRSERS